MPAETHNNAPVPDRTAIFELIRDQLSEILEIDPSQVTEVVLVRRRPGRGLPGPDRARRGPRRGALRAHGGLPDRRRGPRGPEDGARRRRLRRGAAEGELIGLVGAHGTTQLDTLARDLGIDADDDGPRASPSPTRATPPSTASSPTSGSSSWATPSSGLVIAERAYRELDLRRGRPRPGAPGDGLGTLARRRLRGLGLDEALRLGRGEEASGGRGRDSLLADAYEAVVGAVYLADGPRGGRALVRRTLDERFSTEAKDPGASDVKSRLQEWSEAKGLGAPRYEVTGDRPGPRAALPRRRRDRRQARRRRARGPPRRPPSSPRRERPGSERDA